MDYDNLIDGLRNNNIENNCHDCALGYYAFEAATAIDGLRADLARVTAELNDLRAQWDMYGGDVGITETYKELERAKAELEVQKTKCDRCRFYPGKEAAHD